MREGRKKEEDRSRGISEKMEKVWGEMRKIKEMWVKHE